MAVCVWVAPEGALLYSVFYPDHRILRCRFIAVLSGALLSPLAIAQTPVQTLPGAPTSSSTSVAAPADGTTTPPTAAVGTATPTVAVAAPLDPNAIVVNINGRVVQSDPAPQLIGGSIFVPLRGVLESLGAQVNFLPSVNRIDIVQNGQTYSLRPGQSGAISDGRLVELAPARTIGGRAFVPLRALAQLFGYGVAWQTRTRTVAITSKEGLAIGPVDHRALLTKAGNIGVNVDFSAFAPEDVDTLLDQAKASGATLLKFRFDWGTLEPEKGATFNWPIYDRIVKSARERGFTLVGILGNTAPWASVNITGDDRVKRLSPPRTETFPSWSNYVTRVVGRYKNDVQAWQVWENPDASNFYSVPRTYRRLAALALDAARASDKTAIVHLAEPGAVDLNFLSELNVNGLTPKFDGVSVYPVAGFQPGTLESSESFLRPYGVFRSSLVPRDGKNRDFWIGGVSFPTLDDANNPEFSERAQADFAVRSLALGLAASGQKAFYSVLRDEPTSRGGRGLIRADGTPRLALGGVAALSKAVGNLPFAGVLQADDKAVVLLFDNKIEGALVAWSPRGGGQLQLSSIGLPSDSPDTIEIATRPDSLVLDSTGKSLGLFSGPLNLTSSPVIITRLGGETAKSVQVRPVSLQLQNPLRFTGATTVSADLSKDGEEAGINFRKYARFGGQTQKFVEADGRSGLTTTPAVSVLEPNTAKPFIYLDVDDDFLYNAQGVPLTLAVEVKRPRVQAQSLLTATSGFRVEYDGVGGPKTTKWTPVEGGEGWTTITFDLPDAKLTNAGGYDLLINAGGAKTPLTFGKITLSRNMPTAIAQTP